MLTAVDSVGANIAEGYARFHFSEKSRFYYISRASLSEGVEHWIDLGLEREIVSIQEFESFSKIRLDIQVKLNNMIESTYTSKNQPKSDD